MKKTQRVRCSFYTSKEMKYEIIKAVAKMKKTDSKASFSSYVESRLTN